MIESPRSSPPRRPASSPMTTWRIEFVAQAPVGTRVLRRFVDPVAMEAVVSQLAAPQPAGAGSDENGVEVIHDSSTDSPPDGESVLSVATSGGRVHWRPGRAVVTGELEEPALAAICEFTFHEWQIRKLEQSVRAIEGAITSDVDCAYKILGHSRAQWKHFAGKAKELALLRLSASRLEPRAYLAPPDLPPPARRLVSRLAGRAGLEDRLEALSARIEACEDLYEGALDRIADNRWARGGHWLEIGIVALLLIEVLLIVADMFIHLGHGIR